MVGFGICLWLTVKKNHAWSKTVRHLSEKWGTVPHIPHITLATNLKKTVLQNKLKPRRVAHALPFLKTSTCDVPQWSEPLYSLELPLTFKSPAKDPHFTLAYRVGGLPFSNNERREALDILQSYKEWETSGEMEITLALAEDQDIRNWKLI